MGSSDRHKLTIGLIKVIQRCMAWELNKTIGLWCNTSYFTAALVPLVSKNPFKKCVAYSPLALRPQLVRLLLD